ncbi:hypothetical protein [Bradyrhizobium sp.]|uniref:hypothetical protein n=1 Tax=Bradyrhizobium sp. TaxID=376 RepID=UPI003C4BFA0B
MPLLRYDAYRPDISDYEGTSSRIVLNAIPQGDGYGPHPGFSPYTQALPAPCCGAFYALKNDGSVVTFAGSATKLYQLDNTTYRWTDVSAGGASYSAVSVNAQWQFAQTGNFVFATQANAPLQVFDLTQSTAFSAALGSPPQAAYISVIGPFLVLSGLLALPYRIQWSGLNNFNSATAWTVGLSFSDFQDFPDGGITRGIAGGTQSGVVFQDQVIRSLAYVPGSPIVFQIDKITQGMGLFAPYSIISAGGSIFFYAGQGFQRIDPGAAPVPIGLEKVDRSFIADLDKGNLQFFMGAADPRSSRIYWAYKSNAGTAGAYDKLLGYDPLLDRFFPVQTPGQFLLGVSQSGITLAALDPIAPTPLAITGAANNGSGAIRLTLASEANANFAVAGQNFVEVYGVQGTTEANGTWPFAVIDATHIDLLGSSFANAYASGGQIGGALQAMALSLDDYATAVQPQLGQFDNTATLGFFSGAPLQAIIQSAEQSADPARLDIRGFKPITDAPAVFGSLFYRDTQQVAPVQSVEVSLSMRTGRCDMMRDARYVRFQIRIPAGTAWSFAAGIVPDTGEGASI